MNKVFLKSFAKTGMVLVFSVASMMASADAKQDIVDARQETQIWTTYALSPYLRAHDLKVKVNNGKAVLTGTVDEDINKDLAKEIALGVDGIKDVDNQIVVKSDYVPKAGNRGYGEVVDDVTIVAAVKSRLIWSKFSYISTKVESKGGRVVLTGNVDSTDAKTAATRLAASTRGVIAVSNQLNVDSKPGATDKAKAAANDTSKSVADAWISTKVKSNFFYSSNVSGSDIDVSTSAGIVTLKGKVTSGAERALAIELAENVRGVKSVNAKELVF
ncbi:transporter [Cellvibrio zantedeschiae]|uniref:Transporter n=1 Tax=Cellvibrio zantedeschiae TaxID=1237077 RepID=A0ABQ3AYS0_9GAMM|nr:BON domain-containing protein [Cellvibrio zantedeschiae]GGY71982.1 transporter [Cellvibrio zantedeschiae]